MEAAEALEKRTGRPVVTSNQATVWAAFDRLGIQPAVSGFGSLLSGLTH
jgi:maleate cis-trans isomerase